MAKQLQLRKGTTAEHNTFTGAVGELTYDTQKKQLRVHDGETVGGKGIVGTRIVTTPINADTENTTGVRIINTLGNTNLPFNVYGALNVYSNENFATGALRVYQTFQPDVFSDLFFRKWDGASWSAWDRSVKFSEKNTEAFGVGQTWQNLTSSRASGVTYTNSTARPILVSISLSDSYSQSPTVSIYVGGVLILTNNYDNGQNFASFSHSFIVPSDSTYSIFSPLSTIATWSELR